MTKTELSVFRTRLENRENQLANGNRNREPLAVGASPDELDRIQDASARDYAMNTLERMSSRLREVRTALHRMDARTFGICAGCEESISRRRLTALPWASLCIVCQEAADRDQKAPRGEMDPLLALTA
jgi:RNA polymerase-binding protein DksA